MSLNVSLNTSLLRLTRSPPMAFHSSFTRPMPLNANCFSGSLAASRLHTEAEAKFAAILSAIAFTGVISVLPEGVA
eukprot:Skav204610  [mRNA]  locus=scaffold1712:75778:76005:- [translate_table: standard]